MPRWSGGEASWRETNSGGVGEELLLAKLAGRCGAILKLCVICQQNRTQFCKEIGLLRPLPIPSKCWKMISMDFMTHLPKSKGFDSIMVVVDRVSKMAHFVPTRDTVTTQEVGRLYFNKVVKHHGMQKNIILDRDQKFTSHLWHALWKNWALSSK